MEQFAQEREAVKKADIRFEKAEQELENWKDRYKEEKGETFNEDLFDEHPRTKELKSNVKDFRELLKSAQDTLKALAESTSTSKDEFQEILPTSEGSPKRRKVDALIERCKKYLFRTQEWGCLTVIGKKVLLHSRTWSTRISCLEVKSKFSVPMTAQNLM